jgi:hypothetical protein
MGIIVGISFFQGYSVYKSAIQVSNSINSNFTNFLETGNCSRIKDIDSSIEIIEEDIKSSCANPLIRKLSMKITSLPVNCLTVSQLKSNISKTFDPLRIICFNNMTKI